MARLGYGMLRQPITNPDDPATVDFERITAQIDRYLALGGNYFDTAYTYHGGNSEIALREALVKRYPRDRYILTDKLPTWQVPCREACETYFNEQLERCGVEFFDYYFLHWLNRAHYTHAVKHDFFSFLQEKKEQGKIRHIGFSYHDDAETLERILQEQHCVEVVQLQLNYLDWDSDTIQSRNCYEVAKKYGKPVFVMEPVKGGTLANIPDKASEILRQIHPDWSMPSWAIRFVASQENVKIVLSGMNVMEHIDENMVSASSVPLTESELDALKQVADIINSATAIPCTACRYCESGCPKKIRIPDFFALYNAAKRFPDDTWKFKPQYQELLGKSGKPTDCILCRKCERHCPQHIQITERLKDVAKLF